MAPRIAPVSTGKAFAGEALINAGFKRRSQMTIAVDYAGRCERPVDRELKIRPEPTDDMIRGGGKSGYAVTGNGPAGWNVDFQLRCRQCPACLRARRALWSQRAAQEIAAAARTWFGTITLSPESHFKMKCRAIARLTAGGTNFDELSENDQFKERHREVNKELTMWLKRIRRNSGAPLRVLLVVERHLSGLPHYHVLIHQTLHDRPVTYRHISDAWPYGFTHLKLIADDKAARYVTKYLAKDANARVRASLGYGTASADLRLAGLVRKHADNVAHSPDLDVKDDLRDSSEALKGRPSTGTVDGVRGSEAIEEQTLWENIR